MSLKQKYTWADFKREQGDKAKDLKRTSPEGQKAFEAAFKAKIKAHVTERVATAKKMKQKAEKDLKSLRDSLKGMKTSARKSAVISRIARAGRRSKHADRTIARDEARDL